MSLILRGKLEFLTWDLPWLVTGGDKSADLSVMFWNVMTAIRGQRARMDVKPDRVKISADPASDLELQYTTIGAGVIVSKVDGFGFTNVASYTEAILQNINGRSVIIEMHDDAISITADPAEIVPIVKRNASSEVVIPIEWAQGICGVGNGAGCCIFLTCGENGFGCAKFSHSLGRHLLARKAEGEMRASRIGNCAIGSEIDNG